MSSLAAPSPSPSQAIAAPCPGQLQLFSLHLQHTAVLFDAATALLSADEHERMSRMRAGAARDEVILARATLRALLGCMMLCPPRAVPLTTSAHGKPQLDPRHTASPIAFNVTHSHGHALFAFTHAVAVGVDLERIDPRIEAADIAAQNFTPAEQQAIASCTAEERPSVFAAIWVRKEAVLKAHGAGLRLPLASFTVDHRASAETPVLLQDASNLHHQFFLREVPAPTGFAAALATAEPDLQLLAQVLSATLLGRLFAAKQP